MATKIIKNDSRHIKHSFATISEFCASLKDGDTFDVMIERDGKVDYDTTRTLLDNGDDFILEDKSGAYLYEVTWDEAIDELKTELRGFL